MKDYSLSRRTFVMGTAAATLAGCASPTVKSLKGMGFKSPNEKLNIASVAAGGKATSDIRNVKSQNIIALADPDQRQANTIFQEFPNAKRYKDFRVMLNDDNLDLDACIVSTPDHVHAVAAGMAMKKGLGVYVQKPMAHSIWEVQRLLEISRETGAATQMGNQGHSGEGVRRCCEMIWSGAIGDVYEVHAWTNRPIWPQGIPNPLPEQEVPEYMDWDLWLGPAQYRPYNEGYAPFKWRGWYDFGVGALGDMACHILDAPNWALLLDAPISVECLRQDGKNDQTYPTKSILRFDFATRGSMPPVTLYWYDGGLKPPMPEGLDPNTKLGDGDNGSLFIGTKGMLTIGTYGGNPRLLPDSVMENYKFPPMLLTRSPGHPEDWLRACKGGSPACSNFEYAAPFTKWILLGTVALRVDGKLYWDKNKQQFTNSSEANTYLKPKFRPGYTL